MKRDRRKATTTSGKAWKVVRLLPDGRRVSVIMANTAAAVFYETGETARAVPGTGLFVFDTLANALKWQADMSVFSRWNLRVLEVEVDEKDRLTDLPEGPLAACYPDPGRLAEWWRERQGNGGWPEGTRAYSKVRVSGTAGEVKP